MKTPKKIIFFISINFYHEVITKFRPNC